MDWFATGYQYIVDKRWHEAIDAFNNAIEQDQQYAAAYINRGIAHHYLGDFNKAIADYNEAIGLKSQIEFAYYNLGVAHHSLGNYIKAIAYYDKAIELNPQDTDAQRNRDDAFSRGNLKKPCDANCGLHVAKLALINKYPTEYSNTNSFVRQNFDIMNYDNFDNAERCMRYMRQYMPLHIPPLEEAIKIALDNIQSIPLKILDVGSGPGTLYCALSRLIKQKLPNMIVDHDIEYNPLEPSSCFFEFFDIIAEYIKVDKLTVGNKYNGNIKSLTKDNLKSINWIFLGNAVTPLISETGGNITEAATNLVNMASLSDARQLQITLAENNSTSSLEDFCAAINDTGKFGQVDRHPPSETIEAHWLASCYFKPEINNFTPTRPVLKLRNFIRR